MYLTICSNYSDLKKIYISCN